MQDEEVPRGAEPWFPYFTLVLSIFPLMTQTVRWLFFMPIYATYFSVLILREPQTSATAKSIARITLVLGIMGLMMFCVQLVLILMNYTE
ncbi:MAG: hypothetical protein FWG78_01375 [Coriobacteriia bacterium]|nr:hypothetical protein [Coriobacteriia bacterium]